MRLYHLGENAALSGRTISPEDALRGMMQNYANEFCGRPTRRLALLEKTFLGFLWILAMSPLLASLHFDGLNTLSFPDHKHTHWSVRHIPHIHAATSTLVFSLIPTTSYDFHDIIHHPLSSLTHHTMAGSQEPASPEPDTQEFTTMEPDPANDIEMADTDHPIEQDEPMIDSPEAEIALPESNALGTAEIEPSTPENIDMMESDPPVEQGESSPDKPAAETALPESNDADIHGYNPSMTDDLDTFNDFGAADLSEMLPKPEPEPSQNDAFGHLEAEPVTPRDASPTESVRPLDLREASLGKSRSEKALSEEGAHDQAPADFVGSGHVSPVESVHDSASAAFGSPNRLFPIESANSDDAPAAFDDFGYVSPTASVHDDAPAPFDGFNNVSLVESVGDAVAAHPSASNSALPTESIQSIDLGRSALGKPKQVLNLGTSSLSKPASQASRDKAKALQVRLAKQFAEKSAAKTTSDTSGLPSSADAGESIFSAPSNFFSPHGAGGSAFSTTSDNFTPSEFDEPMRDVHPDQAEFEAFQEAYLLKKQAGTNDIESDVAFLKAEAKESARKRKAETDEQHEREPSPEAEAESESNTLFVTPTVRTPASHAPASSEGGFGEDAFFTSAPKPSKRKGGASGDMAPPKKKQSKKTGRSLGGKRGKDGLNDQEINETLNTMQMRMQNGSKVPIAQPAAAKKTTKTSSRGPVPNVSNVDSMLAGTDVFADTQAVAGHSNQPGFKAGTARKDHALRDLIASVPQDERPAAAGDKKFLETSLKDFDGQGSCKPSEDGSGWTLRGMKCTLKHYQVLGIAFMRKRENHKEHPRGGILADEMGLGKTIQMIANIINGKPKQGQPRTTLIVASPALISQWYAEILKFTMNPKENKKHGIARIIQHRAGYRQGGDDAQIKEAIMESDICLTTYSEINKSYPKADVPAEITTDRGKAEWWRSHFQENKGVFHDMKFLRVVLDEAQAIKNHTSHCSMSCRALISEYYWAISGTPLVNGITEMYPYLKFLRHPHTGSMRTFQANFCSPNDPTGSEKLGVFLRQIIIRRTHKDLLFGARLLDLPTPKQNVIYLEFNAVERTVYEIVKQRFIQRINTITRRDGINGGSVQYSHIWTMLLRLRQICCHVLLIQGTIMDLLEREDYQKLDDITREFEGHSEDSDNVLKHLRTMLEVHKIAAKDGEDPEVSVAGVDVDVVPGLSNTIGGPELSLGKNHGKSYPFQKYLTTVAQSEQMAEVEARMTCCWCGEKPDMAQSKIQVHGSFTTSLTHFSHLLPSHLLQTLHEKNAARCSSQWPSICAM